MFAALTTFTQRSISFLTKSRKNSGVDVPLSTVTQVTCLGAVVLPVCSNSDASGLRQYRLPKRLPRPGKLYLSIHMMGLLIIIMGLSLPSWGMS